jgi:putative phosphoesterase
MRILIASDLHGGVKAFERILENEPSHDMVLLLGDYLYHGPRNPLPDGYDPRKLSELINSLDDAVLVKGNVDAPIDEELIRWPMSPLVHIVLPEGFHLLAHHGDKPTLAKLYSSQVVLSGHTHIKVLEYDESGVLHLNPGSPSLPKDGIPSYAVMDGLLIVLKTLDGDVIKELNLVS